MKYGMRRRKYTVLSGSIFAIWSRIEHHLRESRVVVAIKIIRLKTTDGSKIVGVLLTEGNVDGLIADLSGDSISMEENTYEDN